MCDRESNRRPIHLTVACPFAKLIDPQTLDLVGTHRATEPPRHVLVIRAARDGSRNGPPGMTRWTASATGAMTG
jgi:hypothetical protein